MELVSIIGHDRQEHPEFKILNIRVSPSVRLISHPVESGGVVFDHKAKVPRGVTVTAYVDEADSKKCRRQVVQWLEWKEPGRFMGVQTRGFDFIDELLLESAVWAEDSEKLNVFDVTLNFKQIMLATAQQSKYDPADTKTQRAG